MGALAPHRFLVPQEWELERAISSSIANHL